MRKKGQGRGEEGSGQGRARSAGPHGGMKRGGTRLQRVASSQVGETSVLPLPLHSTPAPALAREAALASSAASTAAAAAAPSAASTRLRADIEQQLPVGARRPKSELGGGKQRLGLGTQPPRFRHALELELGVERVPRRCARDGA